MVGAVKTGTISAAGETDIGPAGGSRVSSWLIQFEDASFSGSVTVKGAAQDTAYTALAIGYKDMATSAVATAAITGNALILVDSSGCSIQLDCTSYTSGDLNYTCIPLVG